MLFPHSASFRHYVVGAFAFRRQTASNLALSTQCSLCLHEKRTVIKLSPKPNLLRFCISMIINSNRTETRRTSCNHADCNDYKSLRSSSLRSKLFPNKLFIKVILSSCFSHHSTGVSKMQDFSSLKNMDSTILYLSTNSSGFSALASSRGSASILAISSALNVKSRPPA